MCESSNQGDYFAILVDTTGTEFVRTGDEVLVIPLTDRGEVIFTIEPSAAFGELTVIVPGGETKQAEPQMETANRELQEEIGYTAGKLDYLGEVRPFSKYLTVRSSVYLARDLRPSQLEGDEAHPIGTNHIPLCAFEELISQGRLHDARVIAGLYLARRFLSSER